MNNISSHEFEKLLSDQSAWDISERVILDEDLVEERANNTFAIIKRYSFSTCFNVYDKNISDRYVFKSDLPTIVRIVNLIHFQKTLFDDVTSFEILLNDISISPSYLKSYVPYLPRFFTNVNIGLLTVDVKYDSEHCSVVDGDGCSLWRVNSADYHSRKCESLSIYIKDLIFGEDNDPLYTCEILSSTGNKELKCSTADEIVSFFGTGWLARALYQKAGIFRLSGGVLHPI